jgi:hypothetical protein
MVQPGITSQEAQQLCPFLYAPEGPVVCYAARMRAAVTDPAARAALTPIVVLSDCRRETAEVTHRCLGESLAAASMVGRAASGGNE